jgi:hypothetical protein
MVNLEESLIAPRAEADSRQSEITEITFRLTRSNVGPACNSVYLLSFGQKPTRRKVGEGHKCGIHFFDEFAVGF